eukprot:TRINITY_DN51690_c0_g2_i1.p1 TRINITY_DN51690_c0_g2~~TRINITY_DN51690_c0_g2_i1.p1  ORF type:complete len:135 (-),score=5.83 TRINITY_DN51690_c0_g2_i1:26-430(-)
MYMPHIKFDWNPAIFKVLGIKFSVNVNEIVTLNYDKKLEDIQHILASWSRRQLTPFGKITIIKNMAVSKIIHLLISLPDPSPHFLTELNKCFYNFLWSGKHSKLSKSFVCSSYEKGGLKMLNIYSFLSLSLIHI